MHQPIQGRTFQIVFIAMTMLPAPILRGEGSNAGQDLPVPPQGAVSEQTPSNTGSLEKLLDLAEKDVAQLSQVKVKGATGSPMLDTPVSTVERRESTVGQSPAAVYVITNEMIRRSGAKCIPDVLRLAPGVEVARIDANKWAISIRGFNGRFASKLLVQIDGRAVYTPLFGGVFWDVQDLLLEDVERIEVIRGPGASIWGANAVNGIINIVTKSAKETQGAYLESGTGTEELGFTSLRYGGGNGEDLHYRFYGKWFERGAGVIPGEIAYDAWRQARCGFRADWNATAEDTITFQGDFYNGYSGDQSVFPQFTPPYYYMDHESTHVSGENALLRWRRVLSEESDWQAQVYYDRTERHWVNYGFAEDRNTFDFDSQYRFSAGERHEIISGCGYRHTADATIPSPILALIPPRRSDYILSYFAQDQITLVEDRWYLTLGSKFEHNSYTNFEYEPTVRALWTPDKKRSIWGAVSRAIRLPSRGELNSFSILNRDPTFAIPTFPEISGNPDLLSEELIAYELGYREQMTARFSWDLAVFFYDYAKVDVPVFGLPVPGPVIGTQVLPGTFRNALSGESYGFEWAAEYAATARWHLRGAYSFLIMDLSPVLGSTAPELYEGQSPRNQFFFDSSWDLGRNWGFDLIGRYVDNLPAAHVPSYFAADARIAWRPRPNLEWSLVGRNLFAGNHPEFANDPFLGTLRTEIQEEVYTQLVWRR